MTQLPFTLGNVTIRAAERVGGAHIALSTGGKPAHLSAEQARQVSDALAFAADELDKRKPSAK